MAFFLGDFSFKSQSERDVRYKRALMLFFRAGGRVHDRRTPLQREGVVGVSSPRLSVSLGLCVVCKEEEEWRRKKGNL